MLRGSTTKISEVKPARQGPKLKNEHPETKTDEKLTSCLTGTRNPKSIEVPDGCISKRYFLADSILYLQVAEKRRSWRNRLPFRHQGSNGREDAKLRVYNVQRGARRYVWDREGSDWWHNRKWIDPVDKDKLERAGEVPIVLSYVKYDICSTVFGWRIT